MMHPLRTALFSLLVLAGVAGLAAPAPQPPPPDPAVAAVLQRLETHFNGIRTVQTRFTQEKNLAIFDRPMILKGDIALQSDGAFAWHVTEPVRYSLVMNGSKLRQWDEDADKVQEVSVTSNPIFQAVFSQLRNWFAGRFQELTRDYTVALVREKPLTLAFTPLSAVAGKSVKTVTVTLRDDERYVGEIRIEEAGGDVTVMRFHDTRLNEPVPAAAWEAKPHGR